MELHVLGSYMQWFSKKWKEETAGFKKAKALFPHKCVGEKFFSYNKNVQNGQRSTKSSWILAVITLVHIGHQLQLDTKKGFMKYTLMIGQQGLFHTVLTASFPVFMAILVYSNYILYLICKKNFIILYLKKKKNSVTLPSELHQQCQCTFSTDYETIEKHLHIQVMIFIY